ncbi:hypothetical protein ACYK63_002745 [Enterococcus faecium]
MVLYWSESGEEELGYSLVAVYSDAEAQNHLSKNFFSLPLIQEYPKC